MPTELTQSNIAQVYQEWLEEYSIEKYPSAHREHLGISVIGKKCSREIWYNFRWVKLEQFEGRMRRLFQRGHAEETKFEDFLLWAGVRLKSINPETGKQYVASLLEGHYGGSTDGIGVISQLNLPIIVEYKTHGEKSFVKLKADKLKLAKPEHFAQMCGYGKEFKIEQGLYCAVNKNTDEIYFEFVKLDWVYAGELERKAADIISAKVPPPRISESPSFFDCKYCTKVDICHNGTPVEINCRSCKFGEPGVNASWFCNRFKNDIPKNFIAKGCEYHLSINV